MQTFDRALFDLFEADAISYQDAAQRRLGERPAPEDQEAGCRARGAKNRATWAPAWSTSRS
jgi:hypothetical protein